MDDQGLPGLQARYEFVPAGEAVELRLLLTFDPAGAPDTIMDVWTACRDRLTGGSGDNRLPPAVAMVTNLAAAPLTATADGAGLREQIADFVADVVAGSERPEALLSFQLAKAGAAAAGSDIFRLDVRLEIGKSEVLAVASPRLDRGVTGFATAFEEAWSCFDGAGGRLALAVEAGETTYWCVRTGAGSGLALAPVAAGTETEAYAVPPLSQSPLSGTIEEADGGSARVEAVDLDHWWDLFAEEFGRLAAAAGPGDLRDRFERARLALARAMAGRLVAVAGGPAGEGIEEVRAVFEEAAAADLRSRPVVVVAAVEVSRHANLLGEPVAMLHGRAVSSSGATGGDPVSPGAIRLKAGRRPLAYAAPPPREGGRRQTFSLRFEGERIERGDAPSLRAILRPNALALDLGRQSAPAPLIGVPGPPPFSVAAAMASPDAQALGAALAWTVEIAIPAFPAAQDRLELAIALDEADAPVRAPGPAPDGALFETLGRAVRFGRALPAEPDPDSLARFAAFAEAVADALPGWRAPAQKAPDLPGEWRYAVDFGELPALIVTRGAPGPGRSPPWPELAGYATPASGEATARYEPEAPVAAGLRISVPGLRLLAVRSARVHGRVRRNGNLAEAVDPAFVYYGASASSRAVSPRLEWRAPQPEPPAASLAAAVAALLAGVDEGSSRPYALGLETMLVRRLEPAGEAPFETRIPLGLLTRVAIGGAEGAGVEMLAREIAGGLSAARAGIDPGAGDEELELALTLFDAPPARDPFGRLDFRIAVPGGDAWWSPA